MPKIPPKARFAVVGGGFCGVALVWNLLKKFPDATVHLFEEKDIGAGASGVAAGLLHPFAGKHARLNADGFQAMQEAVALIQQAGPQAGYRSGLLRPALDESQRADFLACCQKYPEVDWLEAEACQQKVPNMYAGPGIWVRNAWVVHCKAYLDALWAQCVAKGAQKMTSNILTLQTLDDYQTIIVAAGFRTKAIDELKDLPLAALKGHVLHLQWPAGYPIPSCPISSHVYMVFEKGQCMAGATFERGNESLQVNTRLAIDSLLPKIQQLFPFISERDVIKAACGIRATAPGHLPLLQQINAQVWVLSGMGSKGLLYHALYSRLLVEKLR